MNQNEASNVSWSHVRSVWWLIAWRSLLGGLILGAVFGAVWGVAAGIAGLTEEAVASSGAVIGALVGMAWGFIVVKMALTKTYKGLKIVLLPTHPSEGTPSIEKA